MQAIDRYQRLRKGLAAHCCAVARPHVIVLFLSTVKASGPRDDPSDVKALTFLSEVEFSTASGTDGTR